MNLYTQSCSIKFNKLPSYEIDSTMKLKDFSTDPLYKINNMIVMLPSNLLAYEKMSAIME